MMCAKRMVGIHASHDASITKKVTILGSYDRPAGNVMDIPPCTITVELLTAFIVSYRPAKISHHLRMAMHVAKARPMLF